MGDFPSPRPQWRKSSRSGGGNEACVELAALSGTIGIRDSKNPDGPHLNVTRDALGSLLSTIKAN
ncbi:protein of unknown function [Thermomonospora echinospora]|uniref:DUF397 domain-containing protein n=1 Tax=Thermomonospora echinospora TaxID=1992 RepID=A0A1H6DWT0_9ACTN|nr:DUF397 domain-containing protein [Thermomonospora echinospora]SEG89718.1 protein of unknown function [Thermomonospora echinospora]